MPKTSDNKTPKGFLFSTAEAAIKKPGRKDIALILSETVANISGTFTKNSVKAAPVRICMKKIKSGRGKVVVVNSGNANACTGAQGTRDANNIISHLTKLLGVNSSLIYPCSTGVIGKPMPMERVLPSLPALAGDLGRSSFEDVAKAIHDDRYLSQDCHKKDQDRKSDRHSFRGMQGPA